MTLYDPDRLRSGYDESDPEQRPPGLGRRCVLSLGAGAMFGYALGSGWVGFAAFVFVWVLAELRARA